MSRNIINGGGGFDIIYYRYTLRIRTADRDRFGDTLTAPHLAGEAFKRILDAAEAMERVNDALTPHPPQP